MTDRRRPCRRRRAAAQPGRDRSRRNAGLGRARRHPGRDVRARLRGTEPGRAWPGRDADPRACGSSPAGSGGSTWSATTTSSPTSAAWASCSPRSLCGLDLAERDATPGCCAEPPRNLFALAPDAAPGARLGRGSMIAPDRRRAGAGPRRPDRAACDLPRPARGLRPRAGASRSGRPQRPPRPRPRPTCATGSSTLSRRNPLLHFRRDRSARLNLTEASVPLVLDVRNIRAEQLFTWGGPASARLVAGKAVDVGSVVRWEDAPYAAASLDALISAARRDRAEYGQRPAAARRRVPALARRQERPRHRRSISPLVLAPVQPDQAARRPRRLPAAAGRHRGRGQPGAAAPAARALRLRLPETIDLADASALEELRAEHRAAGPRHAARP